MDSETLIFRRRPFFSADYTCSRTGAAAFYEKSQYYCFRTAGDVETKMDDGGFLLYFTGPEYVD